MMFCPATRGRSIDGRFTPEFRKLICESGIFDKRVSTGSSVLAAQQHGPPFLQVPNSKGADKVEHADEYMVEAILVRCHTTIRKQLS